MEFKDLYVYQLAMHLGEMTWKIAINWPYFEKKAIGEQWVESTDSIAASISEGEGRFTFLERKRFYYFSRGSLNESETWLTKSLNRNLIGQEQFDEYIKMVERCRKMIYSCVFKIKQRVAN